LDIAGIVGLAVYIARRTRCFERQISGNLYVAGYWSASLWLVRTSRKPSIELYHRM